MANTNFFAWQLDTPAADNKKFIWDAIQAAAKNVDPNTNPIESPRPEIDIQGEAGAPNIVQTNFDRNSNCAIFVADLTFVGTTDGGKRIPNPNVMIELGFAARCVGWKRTILILNEEYGKAKDLPFDILQNRWPIAYRVSGRSQVRERRF